MSKLVKPWPHFWQYPRDLIYLPGYILFGYAHSLIKLYALITFWDVAWGGRTLSKEEEGVVAGETREEEDIGDRIVETDRETVLENEIKQGMSTIVKG